jgi:HTH-type transcriptional regulator/antitoxin HigA
MTMTYTPAEVFPPGEYLRDELEERGWTITEFAEIIGRPIQAVSEILNGKKEITAETAVSFGQALGTTPELWLNLQTSYRLFQQRVSDPAPELTAVERRARLRNVIPLAEVRSRGWLPATSDLDDLEASVRDLLQIQHLDERPAFALAAKRSNSDEPPTTQQIAWLAHVRRVAVSQSVDIFDTGALESAAGRLPRLLQEGPSALSVVPRILAECGVRLVFSEGLRGGKLDGAVTLLSDGRPVIGLTTRGNRFDGLLFTLLHECAHLTLQHVSPETEGIVDDDLMARPTDPDEIAANDQASSWLFPGGFSAKGTTIPEILEAASLHGVHSSVVIGRIQRDTNNWSLLRRRIPKVRADLGEAGLLT